MPHGQRIFLGARAPFAASAVLIGFGWTAASSGALPPPPPGVQTFDRAGISFSQITAQNVAAYPASGGINRPVGGGDWNFALSRTEVTQGQWIELTNMLADVEIPSDRPWSSSLLAMLNTLAWTGPGLDATGFGTQGRLKFEATELGAAIAVSQQAWFGSALYCNWLHNDKAATLDAILSGAYDLRAWDELDGQTWSAVTRSPGAKFWIPTYDEWAVGAFYDPNRNGQGLPGWWQYTNRLDREPISGPPGEGETSQGWDTEPVSDLPFLLPVGSYPESQSPWGLLDTSGGRSEHLEDRYVFAGGDRMWTGSQAGLTGAQDAQRRLEHIGYFGAESPLTMTRIGFRIATVPAAPSFLGITLLGIPFSTRRRRS